MRAFLLFVFSLIQHSVTAGKPDRDRHAKADVGNFAVPFSDDRLNDRIVDAERNVTDLFPQLDCVWEATFDYWDGNENPQPDEQEKLKQFADKCQIKDDVHQTLLSMANTSFNYELETHGNNATLLWAANFTDLSERYLTAIENTSARIDYWLISSFMGIGRSVQCSNIIDEVLNEAGEWEKAGASAATTLMALVPTFLAFGNLYVPRSSEAFATSWLIGLGAALYSLGLPVRSKNAVPRGRVMELGTFGIAPLSIIADLGAKVAPAGLTLPDLYRWTREGATESYMRDFAAIRRKATHGWVKRWHWWHVPAVLIAAAQAVIFALAIEPLFKARGVPRFLFGCANRNWTGLYLIISALADALFRLAMWQLADHEVVRVYPLSDKSKDALRNLVKDDPKAEEKTTVAALPPIYAPAMEAAISIPRKIFAKILRRDAPVPEHPSSALFDPVREQFTYFASVIRHPLLMLKSGFAQTGAARRWRPLVMLIHLSTEGRPQLKTLFTGFIEAALLLVLTFFFAAQWGGNLYITAWALGFLLLFITIGRALGLIYVWLSSQVWGLHVINCDEPEEILGCLRIVCSMEDVLIAVNGAHYFSGYRLDYLPAFKKWRVDYYRGMYDDPDPSTSSKKRDEKVTQVSATPKIDPGLSTPTTQQSPRVSQSTASPGQHGSVASAPTPAPAPAPAAAAAPALPQKSETQGADQLV